MGKIAKSATSALRKITARRASMMSNMSPAAMKSVAKKKSKLAVTGNQRALAMRKPKPAQFKPVAPGGAFRAQPGIRTSANANIKRIGMR